MTKLCYTVKRMDIEKSLISLGLSKNAASVYIDLLGRGISQAGPIVKATKLHRMLVYNAIDELSAEGIVLVQRKKNIKMFTAVSPEIFLERSEKILAMTKSIIPMLDKLQTKANDLIDVRTLIGEEGFRKNLEDIIDSASKQSDRTIRIIGGAKDTDFYKAVGNWYEEYLQLLADKSIKKLLLAPTSYSNMFKRKFAEEDRTLLRVLPDGLTSPIYTRITDEMVAIEIYEPTLTVIQIRNKAIARGYRDSFDLLWKSVKV